VYPVNVFKTLVQANGGSQGISALELLNSCTMLMALEVSLTV